MQISLELSEMRFVEGFTPLNKDDTIEHVYTIIVFINILNWL